MSKVNSAAVKKLEMVIGSSDFRPIVKTMILENWVKSEGRATELIGAFLQWFLMANHSEHDRPYVMFHGPVDKVFHAFVLNTEFYAAFCAKHVGKFINHNPLDAEQASVAEERGGITYTIETLEGAYGNTLHPELKKWVRLAGKGKLKASSISCVRCDYVELYSKAA